MLRCTVDRPKVTSSRLQQKHSQQGLAESNKSVSSAKYLAQGHEKGRKDALLGDAVSCSHHTEFETILISRYSISML